MRRMLAKTLRVLAARRNRSCPTTSRPSNTCRVVGACCDGSAHAGAPGVPGVPGVPGGVLSAGSGHVFIVLAHTLPAARAWHPRHRGGPGARHTYCSCACAGILWLSFLLFLGRFGK